MILTIFEGEFFRGVFVQHEWKNLLLQKFFTVPTVLTAVNENVKFSVEKKIIENSYFHLGFDFMSFLLTLRG